MLNHWLSILQPPHTASAQKKSFWIRVSNRTQSVFPSERKTSTISFRIWTKLSSNPVIEILQKNQIWSHCVVDLAAQPSTTPVALKTIAERNDISLQFLEHIFASFRRTGIVKSVKGSREDIIWRKLLTRSLLHPWWKHSKEATTSKMRMLWRKTVIKESQIRFRNWWWIPSIRNSIRFCQIDFGTNERILFRSLRKTGNVLYLNKPGVRDACPDSGFFYRSVEEENTHMSIKKIAEKAGVSISTVSRILNRPDYKCSIPASGKSLAIAMEMNYVQTRRHEISKKDSSPKKAESGISMY